MSEAEIKQTKKQQQQTNEGENELEKRIYKKILSHWFDSAGDRARDLSVPERSSYHYATGPVSNLKIR